MVRRGDPVDPRGFEEPGFTSLAGARPASGGRGAPGVGRSGACATPWSRRAVALVLLLGLSGLAAAPLAHARADATPTTSAPSASPVEDEVQGTCRSPREAMLQLLYWIQDGDERVDLVRAAACLEPAGLGGTELAARAGLLKRTLDARGLYVDVDAIPQSPDYLGAEGSGRWRLPGLRQIEIAKVGDRWLFSAATVRAIPSLHESTIPPLLDRLLGRLPGWFHEHVLGVRVWQLCGMLLIVLFALGLQRLVVLLVTTYARRAVDRFALLWAERAVGRLARPIGGLAMAAVFSTASPWLQLSVRVSQTIRFGAAALAAFSAAWLGYRLIDVLADWLQLKADATASKIDDQLVPLLRKTLKVVTAVLGGIFVLQNLDVDVGSLLAGLGLGGLAFALAARDTVANFFGSLVVFIDKPFQIGDWVVIDGVEGVVEEVGFRTTRIRTFYDSRVTVPNAKMTDTSIDNYGARKYRRYVANLGLTYDTPPDRMEAFCAGVRGVIQRIPGMRRDYAIVEFNEYGDSGLNVMVYCFMDAPDWPTELRTRTLLNLEVLKLGAALGVSFAFPTRTLHIDSHAQPTAPAAARRLDATQLADVVKRFSPSPPAEPSPSPAPSPPLV